MKELSIEQKAKAYDEAIERVENIKTGKCETTFMFTKGLLEHIFPELKESEDERIRKAIITLLNTTIKGKKLYSITDTTRSEMLAWLEKQGEQKPPIIDFKAKDWYVSKVDGKIYDMTYNPTDKVEPKFHEGEWVVWDNKICCHIDSIYQGKNSLMYTITDTNNMTRSYSVKGFDNNAYLWTIQDAKDGDVLVDMCDSLDNPLIFILKDCKHIKHELGTLSDYHSFCYLKASKKQEFCIDGWHNEHNLMPATKEQRDLLFQKMKEAGYEWDAEKLELRKIEQKPAEWSDKDENLFRCAIDAVKIRVKRVRTEVCLDEEVGEMVINWLKSLKERVQPKQQWSEEDEKTIVKMRDFFIGVLGDRPDFTEDKRYEEFIEFIDNRLKSLRPRTWKPSEEQMAQLSNASNGRFYNCETLLELLEDLKKLKE